MYPLDADNEVRDVSGSGSPEGAVKGPILARGKTPNVTIPKMCTLFISDVHYAHLNQFH